MWEGREGKEPNRRAKQKNKSQITSAKGVHMQPRFGGDTEGRVLGALV